MILQIVDLFSFWCCKYMRNAFLSEAIEHRVTQYEVNDSLLHGENIIRTHLCNILHQS